MNATAIHDCVVAFSGAIQAAPEEAAAAYATAHTAREAVSPPLAELAKSFGGVRYLSSYDAAGVQLVVNQISQADGLWPAADQGTPDKLAAVAPKVVELLSGAAIGAIELTVGGELSRDIGECKPGQSIDLSEYLRGKVPASAVGAIVAWLGDRGNVVTNSVVDASDKRIYRLPKSWSGRAWRFPLAPILTIAASVAVLVGAAWLARQAHDKSLSSVSPWLEAYVAVLLGAALHFGLAMVKQRRKTAAGDAVAITTDVPIVSKWWQWLMLRPLAAAGVLVAPVTTVLVLRLLGYGVDLGAPRELSTYLLAGYSADSIATAASKRLDDLAGVVQQGITSKLA